VVANLARHVDADPEGCLNAANAKFERRFKGIEQALRAEGKAAADATLDEMEALWQAVKRAEKPGVP
jgi:ATP diphosphatase